MRNPNGYGCIKKLSGTRRKPYAAYVTAGYVVDNGKAKQVQKAIGYFANRQEAMIALAEYNRLPYSLDDTSVTLSEAFIRTFDSRIIKLSKSSQNGFKNTQNKITSKLGKMKVKDIRAHHLQETMESYDNLSSSSQKQIIKDIHAVFRYCMENDIISKDYSEFLKVTSDKETEQKAPFTQEEVNILWDNLENDIAKAMLIMIYTGMRIGELLALTKSDIHLKNRIIEVHGKKTKAAERRVPIHKKIEPILKDLASRTDNYLLPAKRGGKFNDTKFRLALDELNDKIGLNHTPHECRHTFITFCQYSRLDNFIVKSIVGHTTKDVTQSVYTHPLDEDLIREIDKLVI